MNPVLVRGRCTYRVRRRDRASRSHRHQDGDDAGQRRIPHRHAEGEVHGWGSRTCSQDKLWAFENYVRSAQVIADTMAARKSLIVEKSAAMCRPSFATSQAVFATSPVFAPAAAVPFSLLSNSLKKKKKEYEEGQEIDRSAPPRVKAVLPSVAGAAYFLCHEFSGRATRN
ncbi:hypothetical protein QZM28_19810 [Burkholderia multivorans]|jgi:hypothetical protein|nr:hypothetical protein [Burkholderia multivorans]